MVDKRKASQLTGKRDSIEEDRFKFRAKIVAVSSPETSSSTPEIISYPNTSTQVSKQTAFQLPTPLISFSYSPSHELEFTNSALRYFVDPPVGAKLGYGYDRWVTNDDDRGRIDNLLRAFSRVRDDAATIYASDVGVVAWRGIMTKILTAPYEDREGWELNVMAINGTMYFEEHFSDAKLQQKNNMDARQRLMTYYGYAFESYCTSETLTTTTTSMSGAPLGWSGDVNTNVQWCNVVRTKLGDTRMVIGGEVDCIRGQYTGRTDNFVELKTSLTIRGASDEARFEKKLLKFYFQSFLLGVPEIVVGFRTPAGVVTTIQSFKTIQIPRLVRGKPGAWDPLLCLDWGHQFLTFMKGITLSKAANEDVPSVWRVKFVPGSGASVTKLDENGVAEVKAGEERVGFLPTWYINELAAPRSPNASRSSGSS